MLRSWFLAEMQKLKRAGNSPRDSTAVHVKEHKSLQLIPRRKKKTTPKNLKVIYALISPWIRIF